MCALDSVSGSGTRAFVLLRSVCFRKEGYMNIGEPVRELEVEPLLYPAALPEAPPEPQPASTPGAEPVETPS